MRSYEMMIVLDPRLPDEETSSVTEDFRKQVEATGAEVIRVEEMGRRKLAYEIQKLREGHYVLFHILSENSGKSFADVERRLQQSDKVLRYLTVRTDEARQRAGLPSAAEEVAAKEAAEKAAEKAAEEAAEKAAKEAAEKAAEEAGTGEDSSGEEE